jgi:hypothetical protein
MVIVEMETLSRFARVIAGRLNSRRTAKRVPSGCGISRHQDLMKAVSSRLSILAPPLGSVKDRARDSFRLPPPLDCHGGAKIISMGRRVLWHKIK